MRSAAVVSWPRCEDAMSPLRRLLPPSVYHHSYSPPWPPTHRFPMWKFHDLALQLLKDQLVTAWEDFVMPQPLQEEWIFLAHEEDYYRRFCSDTLDPAALRRIGFAQRPDHRQLVARTCWEAAGTLTCAREALKVGMAGHCAGGTHHAHRAWGSGYTVLNDLAITAKVLLQEKAVSKILICDLDVHQGDGTAEILQDEPRAFTMSVHCKENFPFGFKGLSHLGHDRSDLDVALPKGLGDEEYLATIFEHLQGALEDVRPELVLYDAGVDIHVEDDLGNLCISWKGLRRREEMVLELCTAKGVPVAFVIGGGYHRKRPHLTRRHAAVFHAASAIWRTRG
ncbi:unnamed protein product [Durusdinium trenchii]|uniref:Histone deacetylase domain-containing protein n=1 Tax=Durusdinium trenchii TaxID=1381693 RepID=A0ABP0S210_9DINO